MVEKRIRTNAALYELLYVLRTFVYMIIVFEVQKSKKKTMMTLKNIYKRTPVGDAQMVDFSGNTHSNESYYEKDNGNLKRTENRRDVKRSRHPNRQRDNLEIHCPIMTPE